MSDDVHLLQDDGPTVDAWLLRCERLHRTLRPSLPTDYGSYLRRMFSEGAQMAALHLAGEPKALTVYRIHHTTFQGLRFYIDDLVTNEEERGHGHGGTLLAWCEAKAKAELCDTLALDSGVQRFAAHRFYLRHGLSLGGFSFAKDLRSQA